jgi:hypothetical protein
VGFGRQQPLCVPKKRGGTNLDILIVSTSNSCKANMDAKLLIWQVNVLCARSPRMKYCPYGKILDEKLKKKIFNIAEYHD